MYLITVSNEKQQSHVGFTGGSVTLGRAPQESDGPTVVIDDPFVSRQHIRVSDRDDRKMQVENIGRNSVFLLDGKKIESGQSYQAALPIRLTCGKTAIVIDLDNLDSSDRVVSVDETRDVEFAADMTHILRGKVAEFYPFPLAHGYTLLESFTNAADRYKEQLRLAENALAFVSSLSLALLDEPQLKQVDEKLGQSAVGCWQGGISPGFWLDFAIEAANQLAINDEPLCQGLARLDIKKSKRGFGKIVRDLIKAKNDFKHDRGPAIHSEYVEQGEYIGGHLNRAYEYLSFLTDHPILLVQDVTQRRRSTESDVVFLKCMGNHPGFATELGVHTQQLCKGDLYVELAAGRLVSLFPFLQAATCLQCKSREFYFIDRLDGSMAGLKSFDRGHTQQDADTGRELADLFGAVTS